MAMSANLKNKHVSSPDKEKSMPNNMTWVRLYSIIIAYCDNLDGALDEIREYADVLLFQPTERSAFISTLQSRKDPSHLVIMAEVHRAFARRVPSIADPDVIRAIGESLCAHGCIDDDDNRKNFRRILDLDNHSSSSYAPHGLSSSTFGRPVDDAERVRAAAGYPLFEQLSITIPQAEQDDKPADSAQSKIVTGAVDHATQYKFGAAAASTPRKFGATKPSASRSNRT